MLASFEGKLKDLVVVLASASPRRREILCTNAGLAQFQVYSSNFPENLDKSTFPNPVEYVSKTCLMKALATIDQINTFQTEPHIIISADTIVVLNDTEILEKPLNSHHAVEMLSKLSGKTHKVMTAVTLATLQKQNNSNESDVNTCAPARQYSLNTFCEISLVTFDHLSQESIEAYVASGEPMDKAGGYGIQGLGSSFISSIQGCYYNIVGFPVHRFCTELLPYLKEL